MGYPVPANEAERIAVVEGYQVTDTPPEISYDDIAEPRSHRPSSFFHFAICGLAIRVSARSARGPRCWRWPPMPSMRSRVPALAASRVPASAIRWPFHQPCDAETT